MSWFEEMKIKKAGTMIGRQFWKSVALLVFNLFYPHNLLGVKNFVARRLVKSLGRGSTVSPGFFVFHGSNFESGAACSFGYGFKVFDFEPVRIGERLLASHDISLIAGTHKTDAQRTYCPGPIQIGNNVWIGANVVIVGPCHIPDNCIIGANSYVTGSFPEGARIGGSPAKLLRSRPL